MSRDKILRSIKEVNQKRVELIEIDQKRFTIYEDKCKVFRESLQKAGARLIECKKEELEDNIQSIYNHCSSIVSTVDKLNIGNIDFSDIRSEQQVSYVELSVVEAYFGVCENGAVLLDNRSLKLYSLAVATKYIAVLLDKKNLLNNMHEAYDRVDMNSVYYALFLCGPSKTADIEQSLVLGAHGCLEMSIFLYS